MAVDSTSYHAIAALDLRYGLAVDGEEFNRIADRIRKPSDYPGQAEWIMKQNHQRDWFKITYGTHKLLAVYDSYLERIVTFLPEDRLTRPIPQKWKN